jgi:hypothetical protein
MATAIRLMQKLDDIVAETYRRAQEAENNREIEFNAAVCIQSWYRAVRVRAYLKYLSHCAIVIQKRWRGCMDRSRFRSQLKQRAYDMRFRYYTAMAIKIQRLWRGFRSRKCIFDFYCRKRYFGELEQRNERIRKELDDYMQQQIEKQKLEAEGDRQKQSQEFLSRNHHLISTFVQPGIYNSPFKEKPNEIELALLNAKPIVDQTRNRARSAEVLTFDPAWTRYDIPRYSPLPPLPDRQMGPFRDPSEVQQQRYKPFRPTLRVMTNFFSVDEARQKVKAEDWIGRISDIAYLPCKRPSPRPYEPLLSTSGKFHQVAYGTRAFRDEFPDVWLSKNFRTVVPPIPVFDKFNDTYSQGTV